MTTCTDEQLQTLLDTWNESDAFHFTVTLILDTEASVISSAHGDRYKGYVLAYDNHKIALTYAQFEQLQTWFLLFPRNYENNNHCSITKTQGVGSVLGLGRNPHLFTLSASIDPRGSEL